MTTIAKTSMGGGAFSEEIILNNEEVKCAFHFSFFTLHSPLLFLLAGVFALAVGALAANTTYYQVGGTADGTALIALDGLTADEEITSTAKLAFPGITLDDIPERASFFTTLYGKDIVTSSISVGAHEQRHYKEGSVDKIALQFVVYDVVNGSGFTKGVTLALTNGDGGVYVQMVRRFFKSGWQFHLNYYKMDSEGTVNTNFLSDGDYLDGSWSSGEEGNFGFQAAGLKVHGLSLAASGRATGLAFPGVTLSDIKDSAFVAGYRIGRNTAVPATNNYATFVTSWPSSGNPEKLVMQFLHPKDNNKVAIIQMTNGKGGVYAFQSHHAYNSNSQRFTVDAATGAVSASGGNSGNRWTTSNDPPEYPVHDLYLLPPCVKKTSTRVWANGDSYSLTLEDIKDGVFTARMCGGYINAKFRESPDTAGGYNTKVYEDEAGNVTNLVVEFQIRDGSNTKCVVVSFENGEDGIYATGLGSKYSSNALGYEFYERDGTWHGTNPNSNINNCFAQTHTANGYGVCDLRVAVPAAVWTLDGDKDWSALRGDAALSSDDTVRIKVTNPDAILSVDEDVDVARIEFVDGSGATLAVAASKTLSAEGIIGIGRILNNGTLVKKGEETAELPFDNSSTGVTIVRNGTLKVASVTGSGTSHAIRVMSGATFDVNGKNYQSGKYYGVTATFYLEKGANLVNSSSFTGYNYNNYQIIRLVLEGDATVIATKPFGLNGINQSGSQLDLGNHTLTVTGGSEFMLYGTTVTGTGRVVVASDGRITSFATSGGDDWTLKTCEGASMTLSGSKVTVGDFENGGAITGNATLTVKRSLTPGSSSVNKLALSDGATIKMTGTDNAQKVASTFSASGEIKVDGSEITRDELADAPRIGIQVLDVPTSFDQKKVKWAVSGTDAGARCLRWVADESGKTLWLCRANGMMLIIK